MEIIDKISEDLTFAYFIFALYFANCKFFEDISNKSIEISWTESEYDVFFQYLDSYHPDLSLEKEFLSYRNKHEYDDITKILYTAACNKINEEKLMTWENRILKK